jgi:hypothetical protein
MAAETDEIRQLLDAYDAIDKVTQETPILSLRVAKKAGLNEIAMQLDCATSTVSSKLKLKAEHSRNTWLDTRLNYGSGVSRQGGGGPQVETYVPTPRHLSDLLLNLRSASGHVVDAHIAGSSQSRGEMLAVLQRELRTSKCQKLVS